MCKQGVASRDAFAGLLTFILVMFLVCIGVGCGASSQPGATNSNGSTLTSIKLRQRLRQSLSVANNSSRRLELIAITARKI